MQWHPLFAKLLRPLVQDWYDVQTNLPVGDAPRQADLVLLRRTTTEPPPFQQIWRHLTVWNVLEFKGPSVDPRLRDLDLLLELGLGIDRRLNEERDRQGQPLLARDEVSFWYLANHLGRRFLEEAGRLLGETVWVEEGVWRCRGLGHVLFLVSRDRVAVNAESVPLHLVSQEPVETGLALARVVLQQPGFWQHYGPALALLHPEVWQEVLRMAQENGAEFTFDLRQLVETVGVEHIDWRSLVQVLGPEQLIATLGPEQIVATADQWLARLTPEQRQELQRRLQSGPPP